MRILTRYVRDDFLLTFAVTLVVLTFVMCVMVFFRVSDFLAMGGPWRLVFIVFAAGLPPALAFSIPVSVMVAALLTFGRLSANGEISAMKSSGISMRRILLPPLTIGLASSMACLYLNAETAPRSYHARRQALARLGMATPLELIEEGRPIRDIPGFTFYCAAKSHDHISDIMIYQQLPNGVQRSIRARTGRIRTSEDGRQLILDLYDVRMDPFYEDRPGAGQCRHFPLVVPIDRLIREEQPVKKKSDLTLAQLWEHIQQPQRYYRELGPADLFAQQSALKVEFHKRIALAISCAVFVLIGVPLATKAHRKESTIGIGISLALVFAFYLFIIVAESLAKHPVWQPHLLAWTPVLLFSILGLYLVHRCE